jgi:hypothetical protein
MKKLFALVLALLLLAGCSLGQTDLNRAMQLRSTLQSGSCRFDAEITADYGDKVYTFRMECTADPAGQLQFVVREPESIADICGTVSAQGGKLTFADTLLEFPLLADGQVSPISAPWLMIRSLQGGYLTGAGMEENLLRLQIDDSFEEDDLTLTVWLDEKDRPVSADILYAGRRILSIVVTNFTLL